MDKVKASKVTVWICEKCTVDEGRNHPIDQCDDCKEPLEYLEIDEFYCDGEGQHYCKECKEQRETRK